MNEVTLYFFTKGNINPLVLKGPPKCSLNAYKFKTISNIWRIRFHIIKFVYIHTMYVPFAKIGVWFG